MTSFAATGAGDSNKAESPRPPPEQVDALRCIRPTTYQKRLTQELKHTLGHHVGLRHHS
jgi:hypothetical protein